MYNDFYGFEQAPFNLTPDPRFLFMSDKHRDALNHLLFGIVNHKGFIQLTGEVGSGKTTICRQLLRQLDDHHKTALILNPCKSPWQMLKSIVKEFGITHKRRDYDGYLQELNEFLLDLAAPGDDAVLIIDEAQNLSLELLEQIRMLSNLETDEHKLLQIVLIGQPELRDMLDDPRLLQLRQRITVRYHLQPLSMRETDDYIQRRIYIAGGNGRPRFSPLAVRRIHRYSKGVPRLVNAVCDMTLLAGYVTNRDHFNSRLVRRAIRDLEGQGA